MSEDGVEACGAVCVLCALEGTDDEIYGRMWSAIQASGRPMVLTVEGNPDDSLITNGVGHENAGDVLHARTCWGDVVFGMGHTSR